MNGNNRPFVQLALVTMLVVAGTTAIAAELQLRFEPDRVIAEGLSPGADAVWLGVVHGARRWQQTVQRIDRVTSDNDQDSTVDLLLPDGVPRRSVRTVVDASTGRYSIATPAGAGPPPVEIPAGSLVLEGTKVTGVQLSQRRYVEALLVEPGLGAWGLTAGDGSIRDGDGEVNGVILVRFEQMEQLHGSGSAPQHASSSGMLIVIDALTLEPTVGLVDVSSATQASSERKGRLR